MYCVCWFDLDPIQGQGQGHGPFELPTTSDAVHAGGDDRSPLAGLSGIKTVSGKVVAQSIGFRVLSIYWQGDDPFPLKSWLKLTHPLLKETSFGTFCLVVPQP